MGKLVTKGKARREYDAERMELTVKFVKSGDDARYVLSSVQEQCEQFLRALSEIGIGPEYVRLKDAGMSENYREEFPIKATREISLEASMDKEFYSYLCDLIKKSEKKIQYSVSYNLEEKEDRNRELLREAVEDARRQADIIAESLGCRVVGVDSINDQDYISRRNLAKSVEVSEHEFDELLCVFERRRDRKSDTPLADRTAVPMIALSEEIVIAWKMEERAN